MAEHTEAGGGEGSMSGIYAVWRDGGQESAAPVCQNLSLTGRETVAVATDGSASLGVSSGSPRQQLFQNDRLLLACDADLTDLDQIGDAAECGNTAAALAAGYERFGCDLFERLRGNFSIVLWDRRQHQLVAAVDAVGVKRLVYHERAGAIWISSRVDALVRSGAVEGRIDAGSVANILNFSTNIGPRTIISGVERIQPGTFLVASGGKTQKRTYWDMRYEPDGRLSESALSRELEDLVQEAVASLCKDQVFADTGAFLSGGTDSSTVVGMMSRLGAGAPAAFSIGFEEQPFNEMGYAEIAAKAFGARHFKHLVNARDCVEALPRMVRQFDEPFGNSSAIPTYFCCRLAAENGVKTMLAGDGGDELFGGNERYATDRMFEMYHSVPAAIRNGVIEPALRVIPLRGGVFRRARNYVNRAKLDPVRRLLSFQFLSTHDPATVFEPGFLAALGSYTIFDSPSEYYAKAKADDVLDRILYCDVKITLGDSDLPKVTSMADLAGVNTRYPFLSRSVMEFSGRISPDLKVKGFEKRYLFKKAFANLLPVDIIKKKKHGFGIPVSVWMKTDSQMRELLQDTMRSQRAAERGFFRREFIEHVLDVYESDESTFYGDTLWTLLVLELWQRQAIDQPAGVAA